MGTTWPVSDPGENGHHLPILEGGSGGMEAAPLYYRVKSACLLEALRE